MGGHLLAGRSFIAGGVGGNEETKTVNKTVSKTVNNRLVNALLFNPPTYAAVVAALWAQRKKQHGQLCLE